MLPNQKNDGIEVSHGWEMPDWASILYEDPAEVGKRDFVFYGGRGGAKSYTLVDAALARGMQRKERIVGLRETMRSIEQSMYALFCQRIADHKIGEFYEILSDSIRGKNGTDIFFSGLRKSSSSNIKSLAGVTIALLDEANQVAESSMREFLPTIREPNSQRWFAFNPKYKTDSVYKRYVESAPVGAYVKKVGFQDNPWWTEELEADRVSDKAQRPWDYAHVWDGELLTASSDSVYAAQMVAASTTGRLAICPHEPSSVVHTGWDIGGSSKTSDATAIWFYQLIQGAIVFIDYHESVGKAIFEICADLAKKPYRYGTHNVPHDAASHHPTSLKSVVDYINSAEIGSVRVMPPSSVIDGVENCKILFHRCFFDVKGCELGIEALNGFTGKHDHFSHGADAFRKSLEAVNAGEVLSRSETAAKAVRHDNALYGRGNAGATARKW